MLFPSHESTLKHKVVFECHTVRGALDTVGVDGRMQGRSKYESFGFD